MTLRQLKTRLDNATLTQKKEFNNLVAQYNHKNSILWGGENGFVGILESVSFKALDIRWQKRIKALVTKKKFQDRIAQLDKDGTLCLTDKLLMVYEYAPDSGVKITISIDLHAGFPQKKILIHTNTETSVYEAGSRFKVAKNNIVDIIVDIRSYYLSKAAKQERTTLSLLIIGMDMAGFQQRKIWSQLTQSKLLQDLGTDKMANVQICLVDPNEKQMQEPQVEITADEGFKAHVSSVRFTIEDFSRFVPKEGWFDYVLIDRNTINFISGINQPDDKTAAMGTVLKEGGKLILQDLSTKQKVENFTPSEIEEAKTKFLSFGRGHVKFTQHEAESILASRHENSVMVTLQTQNVFVVYPKMNATVGDIKAVTGLSKNNKFVASGRARENNELVITLGNSAHLHETTMLKSVKSDKQISDILERENIRFLGTPTDPYPFSHYATSEPSRIGVWEKNRKSVSGSPASQATQMSIFLQKLDEKVKKASSLSRGEEYTVLKQVYLVASVDRVEDYLKSKSVLNLIKNGTQIKWIVNELVKALELYLSKHAADTPVDIQLTLQSKLQRAKQIQKQM